MTVPSEVSRSGPYHGDNVATVFGFDFKIVDAAHIQVIVRDAQGDEHTLVLNVDYSVSGVGNDEGSITKAIPLAVGDDLTILRNVPFVQETDLENQGAYYAETVEDAFDFLTMQTQQLKEKLDRAVTMPENLDPSGLSDLVADIIRLGDSADNIDTVANNIGDVNTVADNIANVNTVANNIAGVNDVAAIKDAVVDVAGIKNNVNTVAGDHDEIVALAAITENINTVAGIASNVSAVAGNAANINAVADNEANIDAVAGNAANINAVAENEADINNLSANMADINTVADNIADVTNFADVYLGPKSVDPATRNDGTALHNGDLYFNTTTKQLKIFDGAAWQSVTDQALNTTPKSFVGDGSTASFTLDYDPLTDGNVLVWVGGVRQVPGVDYAVSGTTLTLTPAPGAGVAVDTLIFTTTAVAYFLQDGQVTTPKIADNAVTLAKIGSGLSTFISTRSVAMGMQIPSNILFFVTGGSSSLGDGRGGLYVRVSSPPLGDNIITNGDFSEDASWIKGTGWTISAGKARKAVTGAQSELGQTRPLIAGTIYAVTYTISEYSGSGWVRPYFGYNGMSVVGAQRTSNGTYTDYLAAAPLNGRVVIQAQATVACSIDDISVRSVIDAFQSADGAWWALVPDINDARIASPATPEDAINAAKVKLDLRSTFAPATVRLLSDKFKDVVSARDFGALGASNDDTTALQNFLNQVKPTGLKAWVPRGDYGLSSTLLLNNQGIPGETPGTPLGKNGIYKRTAIVGDGAGETVFRLVGNIDGLHIQTGLGKAHHRGFSVVQSSATDRLGIGILVDQSQALMFSDVEVKGCFNGITNRDSFSINYTSIDLSENINGFVGENVLSGSHPNAINFNSVRFMDNTGRGCLLYNPTTCNFFGGSFEGNGTGDAVNGGLEVIGASNEGSFGINVIGTYFENNYGGFDVRISNFGSGTRPVIHRIKGCTFNRISSARFTTNNIRIEKVTAGYQKVVASENAFNGFNTYVPNAGRKYIVNLDAGGGGTSVLVANDNLYGSATETP